MLAICLIHSGPDHLVICSTLSEYRLYVCTQVLIGEHAEQLVHCVRGKSGAAPFHCQRTGRVAPYSREGIVHYFY